MTTALRDYLTVELTKKVNQHGIVVWQDSDGEYADTASTVCPPETRFAAFNGSWYALRRDIESLLAGDTPPKLVVYAPCASLQDDPLEEIRAAGVRFAIRLNTLVRNALKGQLSDQRLAEVGGQARSLTEAEAAIAGDTGVDIRLISVLGASDARTMTLRILTGDRDEALEDQELWAAAGEFLSRELGGSLSGTGHELRQAAMRQIVLTEIGNATGLPDALIAAWGGADANQTRRAIEVMQAWQTDPMHQDGYGDLARRVDVDLNLPATLVWADGLAECNATPAIEDLVFREAVRRLRHDDVPGAAALAEQRLTISPWVRPQGPAGNAWASIATSWRAVLATAGLQTNVVTIRPPSASSLGELLDWYVSEGWKVDRAHRRLETARNDLRVLGDLEPAFISARGAYEDWLDETLILFTSTVEQCGFDVGALDRQGDVHRRWVREATVPVAYIWVDALRFELATDLTAGLRSDGHAVELHAAVAAAPTVTPVGMANLTPGADTGLSLSLDAGSLAIHIDGATVETVADRVARLRAAHGDKVLDRTLDSVAGLGEKELSRALSEADLLLVRSQELDAAGESGMLNAAWTQFSAVQELLRNLVARLGQAGVRRIVIAADHGFITLSRGLGPDRSIDPPAGGVGKLSRRGWVGKGASTSDSTLRVSVASTGLLSDLDLIVPRGLAVFRAGGSKQFFHGGLSPQELVVPVIVIDTEPAPAPTELRVDVSVAGGRITTGAFAATLAFSGDLFTREVTVRVVARGASDRGVVARVVSGDGYDPGTGSLELRGDTPSAVLTFQVTRNLERDTTVEIDVLDARTGVRLGRAEASASADVIVEEVLE